MKNFAIVSSMASAIEEVIQRLLSQAETLWPEAPPRALAISRQIQRPYSHTYRLALVPAGDTGPLAAGRAIYAKIIRPTSKNLYNTQKYVERLQQEFEVARMLRPYFDAVPQCGVVRPVAYFGDLLCLVTEEASGQILADLVVRGSKRWHASRAVPENERHCRRAGILLATLQAATPAQQAFDPRELLEYVEVRLQRLVESPAVPFSASDAGVVRQFLENNVVRVPHAQLQQCGCHCDYAPFNLIAEPTRMTVFDFAMFKTGSVYNDVAYFYHRLGGYLHKPTFSAHAIHALQRAFLEGYNQARQGPETGIENDLMFQILLIKHVINNYSAIMRRRVAGANARLSLPVRLFNRRVFHRYNAWLLHACRAPVAPAFATMPN